MLSGWSRLEKFKREVTMLGIKDGWVFLAYILCILSTLLCVVYGLVTWNRGGEPIQQEDVKWEQEEIKEED